MSKRKRNNRSNAVTAQKPTTQTEFTSTPPTRLSPSPVGDPSAKWRWLAFGVLTLTLLVAWGLYAARTAGVWPFNDREKIVRPDRQEPREQAWNGDLMALKGKIPRREPWKIEAWKPLTDEDKLIDRFVTLHRKSDRSASDLLVAIPNDEQPIEEDEFEQRVASHFLRKPGVTIRDIWKGEPDDEGKPRPAERRYMLVTKGQFSTPKIPVRDNKGNVSTPSYSLVDPIIVVEVNGQSIHPLRTELNKAPS